jgi:hypothetical protein
VRDSSAGQSFPWDFQDNSALDFLVVPLGSSCIGPQDFAFAASAYLGAVVLVDHLMPPLSLGRQTKGSNSHGEHGF